MAKIEKMVYLAHPVPSDHKVLMALLAQVLSQLF
jgi:hypothetical protein